MKINNLNKNYMKSTEESTVGSNVQSKKMKYVRKKVQ